MQTKCWVHINNLFYFISRYTSSGNFPHKLPVIFPLSSSYLISPSFVCVPQILYRGFWKCICLDASLSLSTQKIIKYTEVPFISLPSGPRAVPEEAYKHWLSKSYRHTQTPNHPTHTTTTTNTNSTYGMARRMLW